MTFHIQVMSLTIVTLLQIHLGGMIFDEELQKGVKKRFIPAPVTMSLPRSATYDTRKGESIFSLMKLVQMIYFSLLILAVYHTK